MLAKDIISDELRTLISDLLTYGAAAQAYTDYRTDAYVNTGADIDDLSPSTFTPLSGENVSFTGSANSICDWISTGLTLSNNVAMSFRFFAESTENLRIRVKLNGRKQTYTASDFVAVPGEENAYEICFTGISAEEFADAATACFFSGSTQVGRTVSYSVNTYVCSMQNCEDANLRALVRALYNYGASAAAYADSE